MRPVENPHWQTLSKLRQTQLSRPVLSCIDKNSACGITLDLSHQQITQHVFEELLLLAQSFQLRDAIEAMFSGRCVNTSEQRPALHTALRDPRSQDLWVDNQDILPIIQQNWQRLFAMAEKLRNNGWYGTTGKPICDVVNIGIGGSDLGPRFCTQALADLRDSALKFHFISDADPNAFEAVTRHLSPEQTLFIVASKSFTTPETLYNYKKAKRWIGNSAHWTEHFIAITANGSQAQQMGFQHILPIWSWIGGRFSITSAINFISVLAIGPEHFQQFLAGAHAMDCHFRTTPFSNNLPVLAALIGIWNNNFLQAQQHLILTYGAPLNRLMQYVQQLDMESNGKSIDIYGQPVSYATGPVVWGGPGNQAQHSYYQLLCQGTHRMAIDLVSIKENDQELINKMCQNKNEILYHGVQRHIKAFERINGGVPLSHIQLDTITPFTLGALIAFYEHKIFAQSVIWQINPFDQPGVESAKKFLQKTPASAVV